ncbi:CAP domain-containing protein [Glomus cerebriforme]|uniref:CAP domain-containing protein n=1 Tax=Glomus cerebriforme TaxID=658196 RepID=A0A397SL36_9GLOM|nr:CAP domain-containing protein [Glomus cerebriforme]
MEIASLIDASIALVNDEREKVGAPPLTLDSKLMTSAQKHTDFMVSSDTLTHNDPAGSLGDRIKAAGYDFSSVGENIAKGFGTNDEARVMKIWMGSSGHRANILNKAFTNLGVGFGGGTYWTQDFGRPLSSSRKNKRLVRKRLINY